MEKYIKTDRNGTQYFEVTEPCWKCNGKGIIPEYAGIYGGECFECGGSGHLHRIVKKYTPEYAAKLEARRAKKAAKEAAEREAREAKEKAEREAKEAKLKSEAEALEAKKNAERAKTTYFGNVGDKVTLAVTLVARRWFERPSFKGYGTDTVWVYTFTDEIGNRFVWKTTSGLPAEIDENIDEYIEKHTPLTIKATIKEHSEYDGYKQTLLNRVRVA